MKFEELGLHEDILEGIRPMNFDQMTPVQEQTIPVIMEGRDLIGCAQTGTGKTAAYTLPLLERLLREGNPDNVVKSLIVVPTRELAQQIDVQFQGFSYFLPLSTTVVYGGGDGFGWSEQKQGMLMGTDIVIATPGRLIAHIQNSGIDLSHVEYFVLDEANKVAYLHPDRTFQIQHKPRAEHQTCLNALPRCSLYYSNVKIILTTLLIWGITCPSRSFPVHHAPDVCDISEDEGHKERDVEHGAEGELAAATV